MKHYSRRTLNSFVKDASNVLGYGRDSDWYFDLINESKANVNLEESGILDLNDIIQEVNYIIFKNLKDECKI